MSYGVKHFLIPLDFSRCRSCLSKVLDHFFFLEGMVLKEE